MRRYLLLKNIRAVLTEETQPVKCNILIDRNTGLIDAIDKTDKSNLDNSAIISENTFSNYSALTEESSENILVINDYEGMLVFPGFIDPHVHFRYPAPGSEKSEDWASGSQAALSAGVTTVLEMPNTSPATVNEHGLRIKLDHIENNSLINYGLYGGLTKTNLEFLVETPEIKAIKVYLASTTGDMLIENLPAIKVDTNKVFTFHAEDEAIIKKNRGRIGVLDEPIKHSLIRSEDAAIKAVERVKNIWLDLVKRNTNGPQFHIAHASTDGEISILQETGITYEVSAHHLFCSTDDYANGGFLWKCNPPIRKPETMLKLQELFAQGKIPMLATDHAPHPLHAKKYDPENTAKEPASGLPSLEVGTHFVLSEMANGSISAEQTRKILSTNAAERFSIEKRGQIKKGFYADLAIVDDKKTWTFRESDVKSKCGWSPFLGHKFNAQVAATMVNGVLHNQSNELGADNESKIPNSDNRQIFRV